MDEVYNDYHLVSLHDYPWMRRWHSMSARLKTIQQKHRLKIVKNHGVEQCPKLLPARPKPPQVYSRETIYEFIQWQQRQDYWLMPWQSMRET